MEQRIREAMKSKTFEKLAGTIEADEKFCWQQSRGHAQIQARAHDQRTRHSWQNRRNGYSSAQERSPRESYSEHGKNIHSEVRANVETDSELYTDSMQSYNGLAPDYAHESVDHAAKEYVRGQVHTNGIENFWSLWKCCIKGMHVYIGPKHMTRYLDEKMFRYDNRANDDAGRFLFVATSVLGKRLTDKELMSKI